MNRFFEHAALQPDLGRALRTSVAFLGPLLVCHALGRTTEAMFIATAAQAIALPDLRGAYRMRVLIVATMAAVVAGSAMLGVWAGNHIVTATLGMGLLALVGGGWRHLSADYGPPLSVSSVLLYLLGVAQAGSFAQGLHLGGLILLGGAAGALLQVVFWPFRPEHPLRAAVAESWVAASDLLAAMRPTLSGAIRFRDAEIAAGELELRAALDRTFIVLGAAEGRQASPLLAHLEEMRREVVHVAMRFGAFHTALEPLLGRPEIRRHAPAVDSVFKAAGDAARSVAISLITHRPENFAATKLRLQRCLDLARVLDEQLAVTSSATGVPEARVALAQVMPLIPRLREALAATIDIGEASARLVGRLPELGARSVHSLAVWINPAPKPDPVLIRYALRMAVLTMAAVACYRGFAIPRGYWIAFTIVVVLQPDYGSTRRRAMERIGGTLAGSLLGSALLWIRMPLFLLDGCAALMAFGFGYFLRRRYAVAVFFVTLMLVLITETVAQVHLEFTVTRLLCNAVGGVVALVSALVFWPIWEGEKFTVLLAAAVRANRAYLEEIAAFLNPAQENPADLLMTKRHAENANRYASASLQRMLEEPSSRSPGAEHAAALATYNQRITRACTAMAVHLESEPVADGERISAAARGLAEALEFLARGIEQEGKGFEASALAAKLASLRETFGVEGAELSNASARDLLWTNLAKCSVEMRAMALAMSGVGRGLGGVEGR